MYKITIPLRIVLVVMMIAGYTIIRSLLSVFRIRMAGANYGRIILFVFGLRMKLDEKIRDIGKRIPGTIIISNHSTNMDIHAVLALCRAVDPLWISKKELRALFKFEFVIRRWGLVFVDRQSGGNYDRMVQEMKAYPLERPMVIFPQGGFESKDEGGPVFRSGFARLASHSGRAVLPIALIGLEDLCPDPRYTPLHGGEFRIRVGMPFTVEGDDEESIQKAVARGQKEVRAMLDGKVSNS